MPLVKPRPLNEVPLVSNTTSIATTPVPACTIATESGWLQRVMAASGGTFTGTINVTVTINGGADVAGGALNIPAQTGSKAGVVLEFAGVGASSGVFINEGDCITFTPSGGTGATIPGSFAAVLRSIT